MRQGRASTSLPAWIKDLCFAVNEVEFLASIGPSASGKTTFLNLLAQIEVANGGKVRFQSRVARVDNPKSLKPGLLDQTCRGSQGGG
jgi:ABC-type sugar transport system ATPase subunit